MKTLRFVGLGSIFGFALVTGCAAAAGVNDGIVPEQASPTTTGESAGLRPLTRVRLPLFEVGGGIDRRVGSLTPGVTIPDPAADDPGLPSGDGPGLPSGDDPGLPSGDGTATPPVPIETGPVLVDGNPTCAGLFGPDAAGLRIEGSKDGTYGNGMFSATVDYRGATVDYTCSSTATLLGVIVKGGPHAMQYTTSETNGTAIATPEGEDISHVDFCYRLD